MSEAPSFPASSSPATGAAPRRSLVWPAAIAILVAGADLILALSAILSRGAWQAYLNAAGMLTLVSLAVGALNMDRRGRQERGVWMLILGISIALLNKTLSTSGVGVVGSLIGIGFMSVVGFLYLPPRLSNRAISLSIILAAIILILEAYWPFERLPASIASIPLASNILVAVIVLGLLIFVVRRYRSFSLHTKLLVAFNLAAAIPAIIVGLINFNTSRIALTLSARTSLRNAADQTASEVNDFLTQTRDAVFLEAQVPILTDYVEAFRLGYSDDPDAFVEARAYLDTLATKDPGMLLSYAILNVRGVNIYDTNPNGIGRNESTQEYFTHPFRAGTPYISPVMIGPEGVPAITFSAAIRDEADRVIGILRARYRALAIQNIVRKKSGLLGEGSYAVVLDNYNVYLANGLNPDLVLRTPLPLEAGTLTSLQNWNRLPPGSPEQLSLNQPDIIAGLNMQRGELFYVPIPGGPPMGPGVPGADRLAAAASRVDAVNWTVIFFQPERLFLQPLETESDSLLLMVAGVMLFATVSSWLLAQRLSNPLEKLSTTARRIEQGDLNAQAEVAERDEVGELAQTLNNMTARLRDLISSLEARVEERTRALARRAEQIRAAADVGSAATRLRNLDALFAQVAKLISQRFGFYHVGIFLLDERGEYAVLRASNSEGGQRMLARGHRLRVGQVGIVGQVTQSGQPRIALDVGEDAAFFRNPDLPETRSELCLPLIVAGKVIGALDVQSTEEAAFTSEDVSALQIMADQIAIAFDNARLLQESQSALESARRAYGAVSQTAWRRLLLSEEGSTGYLSLANGILTPVSGEPEPEYLQAIKTGKPVLSNEGLTVYLPITSRDLTIGAIRLDRPAEAGAWSQDDIVSANALVDQLSTSLESARLFTDINRRAMKERAIGEMTTRISASVDVRSVFETAAQEIGRAFPGSEVIVQLHKEEEE
ncbi:MAG: GAF domain-containing protein [Anaerolineales bacterium]